MKAWLAEGAALIGFNFRAINRVSKFLHRICQHRSCAALPPTPTCPIAIERPDTPGSLAKGDYTRPARKDEGGSSCAVPKRSPAWNLQHYP